MLGMLYRIFSKHSEEKSDSPTYFWISAYCLLSSNGLTI